MKKFSQAIALVAVTTLFATAFTAITVEHQKPKVQISPEQIDSNVTQVVIVGKRMSVFEKAQYDLEMLVHSTTQPEKSNQAK